MMPLTDTESRFLLTVPEAAKALAVSPRTLFSMTKDGAIRAVRLSRRAVRYDPADLRTAIEKMKAPRRPSENPKTKNPALLATAAGSKTGDENHE